MGVDSNGHKHLLGLREGATENAEVGIALLEDPAGRGLDAFTRRLFVIDGSKALRKAINQVFGDDQPVQPARPACLSRTASGFRRRPEKIKTLLVNRRGGRNHKLRNVLGHLPKEQHDQAKSTIKAAWKLEADDGMAKLKQYADWLERDWLEHDWPDAAGSLREGLSEMFTINRPGLPSSLRRCLGTTNVIDNSHSATRYRMQRVKNWQNGPASNNNRGSSLDRRSLRSQLKKLPTNHGLRTTLDSQSRSGETRQRPATCPTNGRWIS